MASGKARKRQLELLKSAWRNEKASPAYAEDGKDALMVSLYQMDLDRTEFLLRSYLRTRIQKVGIAPVPCCFCCCKENMENHLKQNVLSRLPYGYQDFCKQSLSSEEDDMVPQPQLDTFVFCKSKVSVGPFQLDERGDDVLDLSKDDFYVLRYKSIKPLVETGKMDLV
ncbi:hypothetical protein MKW94_027526 [Papaver nudicaule]|uniref:DNA replication complex GINS protein SLD5 C-terminal domain-containing protein n=1 Tax=Papaver nudicaule TaxID=74823 RepID=A0AA41VEQ7_PAPNU|nr:hypothetical protein [Papaver nudicaule]